MWKVITNNNPKPGVIVRTKILDGQGERNIQDLKRVAGNKLWWHPNGKMYVYYTPTHYLEGSEQYS